MKKQLIPASTLEFLNLLKQHNNRDWFSDHKNEFAVQQTYIENFAALLLTELNKHDVIEIPTGKSSLRRIYRDTRFSANKTPYKTSWSGHFTRATKQRRGGYYFHIEPGNSFIAGGFQAPGAADLKLIRNDISFDAAPLRQIIQSPAFVNIFGTLKGEQLKTTPKGFSSDNEGVDLLRYKQFLLKRPFTDDEVLGTAFLAEANKTYMNMRPFFDYMSDILTTDVNGLSI